MKIVIISMLIFSFNAQAEKIRDFVLPGHIENKKVHLQEEVKKKKVLLNFWASWCMSCAQEIPQLEALKEKYGGKITFIAINAGEKENLIRRFVQKNKFSYLIVKDEDRIYSKSIGIDSLPVTIVVDEEMNIVYRGIVPPEGL